MAQEMKIKTGLRPLERGSLRDALRRMAVGESALKPEGSSDRATVVACSGLRKEGYVFSTSKRTGELVITRLG